MLSITGGTAYQIRVRGFGNSSTGNITLHLTRATCPFTDDPLVARVTVIRTVHITELRARINALRQRFGLADYAWVDAITAAMTLVKAQHILEVRQALQDAYNTAIARGVPVTLPTYRTTPAPGEVLTVADIAEPRSWVVNLENK